MSEQPRHWRFFRPITAGAARAFVVLSVLTLLLAGAAYFFSVRAVHGEVSARATVVQLCQSGNEHDAKQVKFWAHLVSAFSPPPPHETAAARQKRQALIREFLAFVRKVFMPRDCKGGFKG